MSGKPALRQSPFCSLPDGVRCQLQERGCRHGNSRQRVMSNLILFGAGASFGSDVGTRVPPLGAGLFDALRKFNPEGWGAVADNLASQFRADFEHGMRAFADARPTDVDVLQRAMAAYFFQFEPSPSSLYIRLANRIRASDWNGAVASLNYERLLELSLRNAALNVVFPGAPSSNGGIELCLPHGCCHFFINVQIRKGIVLGSPRLKVDSNDRAEAISDPSQFQKRICQDQLPPVMCYFQPEKQTRSGPRFIKGQRDRLAALVRQASTVAIIGVKVRPHDAHIWDPLRITSARIIYCAGKNSGDEFRSWSNAAGRQQDELLPAHWANAFDDVCTRVCIAQVDRGSDRSCL